MASNYKVSRPGMEKWDMNAMYNDYLMMLIIKYGEARLLCDYETAKIALRLLETVSSPEVDNDEAEKHLDTIEKNVPQMIVKDEMGNIVKYFPKLITETIRLMDKTYALLLTRLNDEGMLTRKKPDPRQAMGKFGGS